ncbi:MAG TPA: YbaK/EbsC family protein [Clostridiales bacterium]|nr:YbaK/EbsC family protein [Clostridiales bacterium]HQP68922.1 YbaK/EbsC family protein [Clostridiales bacterium]
MRMSNLFFFSDKNSPSGTDLKSDMLFKKANLTVKDPSNGIILMPVLIKSIEKLSNHLSSSLEKTGFQQVGIPPEVIAEDGFFALGRKFISSYKQLPLKLYQISSGATDKVRSKFSIILSGSFLKLDACVFDRDSESADISISALTKNISDNFSRLNLPFFTADNHENNLIVVPSEKAEDRFFKCPECGCCASENSVLSVPEPIPVSNVEAGLTELYTPEIKTVKQLVEFTGIPEHQMVKTIIYKMIYAEEEKFAAVLIRGDLDINEIKLKKFINCESLELASENDIRKLTGAEVGFAGPFNLNKKFEIIGDNSILKTDHFLCGLNKTDYHNINVRFGRDIPLPDKIADLHRTKQGDVCASCGIGKLDEIKGFITAKISKCGPDGSKSRNITFDNRGSQDVAHTSFLNLNITSVLGLAAESNNDAYGLTWPAFIAPYDAVIIAADQEFTDQAEKCYTELLNSGYDVLIDDRDFSPGFKFKDADLIGIPYKIIFGKKAGAGSAEIKSRINSDRNIIQYENIVEFCKKIQLN